MKYFILILALVLVGPQLASQSLQASLNSAKKSLKAKNWKDALLSAKAALGLDNSHQEAYFLLHSAHTGAGDGQLALLAALDCYDAPPKANKTSKGMKKKVRKYISNNSPTLNTFLSHRASAAAKILKIGKKANKAKLRAEQEWIDRKASELAPTDDAVLKATSYRSEKYWRLRRQGSSKNRLESGFIEMLTEPKQWKLSNVAQKTKVTEDLLVIHPKNLRYLGVAFLPNEEMKTGSGFTFRYSFKWTELKDNDAGTDIRLYVLFMPGTRPSPDDVFVSIKVDDDHPYISFDRTIIEKGLMSIDHASLKEGSVAADTWIDAEISWSKKTGLLKAKIQGKEVFTTSPKEFGPENMYIGFGAGIVKEYQIKQPRLKIHKIKKD